MTEVSSIDLVQLTEDKRQKTEDWDPFMLCLCPVSVSGVQPLFHKNFKNKKVGRLGGSGG